MRAVTVAAAGAVVVGSVSAASHVKHMHPKVHANVERDTWVDWNATSSTTTTTSVEETSTAAAAWEDWDTSVEGTATSSSVAAATTSVEPWEDWASFTAVESATTTETETWGDWTVTATIVEASAATSTETESASAAAETWSDWDESGVTMTTTIYEPSASTSSETASETWIDWSSEETTIVTLASTVTNTKYIQPLTPAAAESTSTGPVTSIITSTIVPAWTTDSGSCAISIYTSYGLPTWYPTPFDPQATSTAADIWGDWTNTTTSTTPAAVTSTSAPAVVTSTETWGDWTSTISEPAVVTSTTETWGDWAITNTIDTVVVPVSTETWGEWTSTTTESAAVSTETETWLDWASTSTESATATTSTEETSWAWSSPSASASSSAPKPSGGSPGITANGDSWGMTYSPYTAQGGCKDASTVEADLTIISQKGFTSVRVYSTDCSTLENIGAAARKTGLKLILGVWISSSGIGGAQGQVEDIIAWAQWDLVELIVVGNEAVFNGYCSASELAAFVSSCASSFKGAGYTGLITLTEPLSIWEDTSSSSAFCGVVDVVAANLYAFFNADISADKAGSFIQAQIDILDGICSGKAVYVLESGWPSAGDCNGAACPGPQNQVTALKGIQATVGAQVVFLSYEDEPWKEPGQFDVEQHWGCADVF
ncbi:hypothetical protein A1O1_02070 [Capronia coronata CBS 617.96]|uniref:Probable beta-glucosidase btgE n=1 Tax=Capronia coronata CBS 617.96 TaxID=1182541 RepID=W9YM85_9EURO|nr:uncharacterized protein A1O1_02070 [Capronia coronata CBS 617.96]EXJ93678.1 hypothetical protein A1O1_02070 [Capronia coronata CBS 617.96]